MNRPQTFIDKIQSTRLNYTSHELCVARSIKVTHQHMSHPLYDQQSQSQHIY
jgi:hypothetical protein